jgi:SAM-dependent methyltransferase
MTASAIDAFGRCVGEYLTGRPDYPEALLEDLPRAALVVDLGAGTGKFTRLAARTGAHVVAVEPQPAMAAHIASGASVDVVVATAEQIPLAGACADLVCCATAFHWFDYPTATAEIARILKPGAHLALIWNVRDDRVPWVAAIGALLDAHGKEAHRYRKDRWRAILDDCRFTYLAARDHPFAHRMPIDGIVDRVLSTSFIGALALDERETIRKEVLAIIGAYPELKQVREIQFPYVAKLYLLRRLS